MTWSGTDPTATLAAMATQTRQQLADLDGLGARSRWQTTPISSDATASADTLEQLKQTQAKTCQVLTIHPWTQGCAETGQGILSQQSAGYLSPAQAITTAVNKLRDPHDPATAGCTELLAILVSANSLGTWISELERLLAWLPLPELQFCHTRARQLHTLKQDKLKTPAVAMYPHFKARQPHQIQTAADQRRHRGGLLAQMSATVEPDPVTALQDFMTRRQSERDTRLTAFNTWAAGLNPRPVPIIDLQGSGPGDLAGQLQQQMPDTVASLTALTVMIGPDGALDGYRS